MFRKKDKPRILVVFIDYDNIDSHLMNQNKRLDFSRLMQELLKIGKVKHAFLFMPFSSYHGLPRVNDLGFEIIVCQKMDAPNDSKKREDKVDSRMATVGEDFFYEEITDIIILTHDKHSIEFASKVVKSKKTVIYFAIKDEMAKELKRFIKEYKVKVYPLPSKDRVSI